MIAELQQQPLDSGSIVADAVNGCGGFVDAAIVLIDPYGQNYCLEYL